MAYYSSPAPRFLSGRGLFNSFPNHFVEITIADDLITVYVIALGQDPRYPLCSISTYKPAQSITLNRHPALAFESNVLPLPDHAYAAIVGFLKAHRALAVRQGAAA